MKYLIKDTTKNEREKLVYKALGISLGGDFAPSKKALLLAKKYINGELELSDVKKLMIKEYQNHE